MSSRRAGVRGTWERLVHASQLRAMAPAVAALTVSTLVGAIASFVAIAFLARVLDTGEFGQIVFAQATVGMLFSILDPRIEDGVIRYLPLVELRAGGSASSQLFTRALLIDQVIGGGFALVIIAALASSWLSFGDVTTNSFLALAVAQSGVQAASGTASAGFAATGGLAILGWIRVAAAVATTGVSVVALLLGGGVAFMVSQAVAAAALTLLLSLMSLQRVRQRFGPRGELPRGAAKGFVSFSVKASMATTVSIGTNNLPLTLVGAAGGPTLLASYRVALAPSRLVATGFSPIASVMFPILSQDAAEHHLARIRSRILAWTGVLAVPAVGAAVVAWFTMPAAVAFAFGGRYGSVVLSAWILTTAALVRGTVIWSKVFPLAVGRPGLKAIVTLVDGILVAAVAWWGASRGLETIAWGQLGAAVLNTATWVILARVLVPREAALGAAGNAAILDEADEGQAQGR